MSDVVLATDTRLLEAAMIFVGVIEASRPLALVSSAFAILVAFLLVSRLPVYSGKKIRIRRDRVLPMILGIALMLLLLFEYPWQTLSAAVLAYLVFLPLSARAYSRRARIEEDRLAKAADGSAEPPAS